MRRAGRFLGYLALVLGVTLAGASNAAAQGVTSAAVQGRVTATRGPVGGAIVALTNASTGVRQQVTTNASGRYNLENVPPGGPYTIEVRAIGFQPATAPGIMLQLGQRFTRDFALVEQAVTLQEVAVTAEANPLINSGRTGPGQIVTDTAIQRFPSLGRDFTSLIRTSPQVLSGSSVGGQNNRFNAILIDGGVNNDIFGLSSAGTPGSSAGARPLSVEALREFQILTAPFDVRQGGFSGGLVNAITKSGTNQLHGSLFGFLQGRQFVGRDTAGAKISNFDIKQYGGTLGGPIIKDRLHFFGSVDLQSSTTPFIGLSASEPATGIPVATAERVRDIIRTQYGFDPGGVDAPENLTQPDKNIFGKLNWQATTNSQVEVSYNYSRASQDRFNRTARQSNDRDGWQLSNSGFKIGGTTQSARGKFTTLLGGANLEILAGYQRVRDARELPNNVPLIMVQGDPGFYLAAGGERFSHGNSLDQDIYEATANLTFLLGNKHQITIGTHNEFFSFLNVFANNRYGVWTFASADALQANTPNRYEILLEARPNGFISDFGVKQLGGYIQDAWRPTDRLTVTGGVRIDVPFTDKPVQNNLPALTTTLGVNTGVFPSGNALISPRLGFNWDVRGTGETSLRGGVGVFSGRPPYVWMSNAFTNTGLEQVTLICSAAGSVPGLVTDVNNLPSACIGGGAPTPPTATVNYFDEDFKFQQAVKYSLGIDQRLPGGLVGTIDLLHSRNRNQMYQTDINVVEGAVNGEGRLLYATPNSAGQGSLTRTTLTNGVRQVVRHLNRGGDRSTLATFQLQKSFAGGYGLSAAYTYAKTEDVMSMYSSIATSNLRNTGLEGGSLDDRPLRPSGFDVPHKIAISGTANLPWGIQTSVIYTARAGTPYAWSVVTDANGDGIAQNDLMYVPTDASDITLVNPADWARLDEFISSNECLDSQRGQIMRRNSCRQPWQRFMDVRLAKVIRTLSGQSLQVSAEIFNFLNMVNSEWGINRETPLTQLEFVTLLNMTGYDTRGTADQSDDRGRYTVPTTMPAVNRAIVNSSRWRMQLGAKYVW